MLEGASIPIYIDDHLVYDNTVIGSAFIRYFAAAGHIFEDLDNGSHPDIDHLFYE